MKIPKRLPQDLKSLVELEEAFGRLTLLAAVMRRRKGVAYIELTYVDKDAFFGDKLVTLDSTIRYNKYERRIVEDASSHRRSFGILRKAVLAS